MAFNRRVLSGLAGIIMCAACILLIFSNALVSWGKSDSLTVGLWRECNETGGQHVCKSIGCSEWFPGYTSQCAYIRGAKGCLVIACICSGISTLLLFVCLIQGDHTSKSLIRYIKWLTVLSFLSAVIGVSEGIVYIKRENDLSLGKAADLGIVGFVIHLIGTILAIMIPSSKYIRIRKNKDNN